MSKEEKKVKEIFFNNIKNPKMQPFGRQKLMIFLSAIFLITGTMNFFDSIFYFNQIFNPISYTITSLEEKNITFKSYTDYIIEIDQNKTLAKADLKTLLNKTIYIDPNKNISQTYINKIIEYANGNQTEIEKIKLDILGDIVNYAILSVFLIIAAMLTFALRNISNDWRNDMRVHFLREAFGNMACLASLGFWISITFKTKFSLLDVHRLLHNFSIYFNIISNIGNMFLFVLSFNDYFEYKEHLDYVDYKNLWENKNNPEKKNN